MYKIAEIFRSTLVDFIKKRPKGIQKKIAQATNISPKYLSDFVNGHKVLSEDYREKIANFFGYQYEDFLVCGRRLLYPDSPVSETEYGNITEQSLIRLVFLIGVPLKEGRYWQNGLAEWADIEISLIFAWIKNDHIPNEFVTQIAEQGYESKDWIIKQSKIKSADADFRNLAKLAKIDISTGWVDTLAALLDIDSEEITRAICKRYIPPELIDKIEAAGYPSSMWLHTKNAPKASIQTKNADNSLAQRISQIEADLEKIKKDL
ncbi:MAG: helix-turn-helix transcriptional regulator [Desulfobacteraceae bacterium]|nr:helix-turn-helix transcriptional regulator [Desulfobacteraceae bacterium]